MNLYLLRHGEAEHQANSDFERALTEKGRDEVISVAQNFAKATLSVDRCFASPYLRAQQTAALFVPVVSKHLEIVTEPLLVPEVRAAQVMSFLDKLDAENVLLVSHNPLLSELVALLLNGGLENMHVVSTSELNAISLDFVGIGLGNQEFRLDPDV